MGRVPVRRRPLARAQARRVGPVAVGKLQVKRTQVSYVRTRVAFARFVATKPFPPWAPESAASADRLRNLLEDNPTSG